MTPKASDPNNLWVKVKNFGPIGQAEIELRPLTIFFGPGHAGKSYLAMLVHTLHRYFSELDPGPDATGTDPYWAAVTQGAQARRRRGYPALSKPSRRVFERWLSGTLLQASNAETGALWRGMDAVVRSSWAGDYADGEKFSWLLKRYFGVGRFGELIRHRSKGGMQVSVSRNGPTNRALASCVATLARSKLVLELNVSPKWSFLPPASELDRYADYFDALQLPSDGGGDMAGVRHAYDRLLSIASSPFELLKQRSHYLPASRAGLMQTRDAVVSAVIQDGSYIGVQPNGQTPLLPGVAIDFLVNLLGTHRQSGQPNSLAEHASELEAGLLKGEVQEEHAEGIGYPHFFFRPNGWRGELGIPLTNAASMVSELAPIVLYLRRAVQRNQLLIIEEPEAHLHPAAQVELAVHLSKLVSSGLRILLTTHSEWLLEQFTNLVQLSNLRGANRKRLESQYTAIAGAALDGSKVGIWAFDWATKGGGSTVQEIELATGYGGMPEQYETVMRRLYNEWQYIDRHLEHQAA